MKPTRSFLFQRGLYLKFPTLYHILVYIRMIFLSRRKAQALITEAFLFVPNDKSVVKITWLPSPRNHPGVKSAYIGMEGVAEDIKPDGSFMLKGKTNTLVVGNKYAFEYLNAVNYFNEG